MDRRQRIGAIAAASKARNVGCLGSLKDVYLKEARLARGAAKLLVKDDRNTAGVDIVQQKRSVREEVKAAESTAELPTFEECAEADSS
jgi:hypothetical protein